VWAFGEELGGEGFGGDPVECGGQVVVDADGEELLAADAFDADGFVSVSISGLGVVFVGDCVAALVEEVLHADGVVYGELVDGGLDAFVFLAAGELGVVHEAAWAAVWVWHGAEVVGDEVGDVVACHVWGFAFFWEKVRTALGAAK
jgi:hypothetical protein